MILAVLINELALPNPLFRILVSLSTLFVLAGALGSLILLLVFQLFPGNEPVRKEITYTDFLQTVESGGVSEGSACS